MRNVLPILTVVLTIIAIWYAAAIMRGICHYIREESSPI